MTVDRAGQIRARLDAATPGDKWTLDSHAHPSQGCRCMSCYQDSTVWQPGGYFCDDVPHDESNRNDDGDRCDQFGYSYEDAVLISRAPADLAWLLDERDRQAEIITAVTAVVDQTRAEQHSSQSGRRMLGWVLDDLESALRREKP